MDITTNVIISLLIGFVLGLVFLKLLNRNKSLGLINKAKKDAQRIIADANEKGESVKKNKIIQAKEKFLELKSEHEKIIFSREDKIKIIEREISSKESKIDSIIKKQESLTLDLEKKNAEIELKLSTLEKKAKEVEKVRKNQIKQLEVILDFRKKKRRKVCLNH